MTDYPSITSILFDAGHTLFKPKSGNWILPTRYAELLGEEMLRITQQQPELFERGIQRGWQYLSDNHYVRTEAEEYEQFRVFYSMLYADCGCQVPDQSHIDVLAREIVYDRDRFIWFDDVAPMMERLKTRYTLGIVSDTWPSLEPTFIAQNMRDYFSTFVMSAVHGVTKAQPAIFEIALNELNIEPKQALFIDDLEPNLIVAADTGLKPIRIDRYGTSEPSRFPIITSLEDLLPLLP